MRRERRSAKDVIVHFANELLGRTNDKDAAIKLLTIETIAFRMGWNDLYDRLRFRNRNVEIKQDSIETPNEKPEPWWQR
jgi:hypothetical protein